MSATAQEVRARFNQRYRKQLVISSGLDRILELLFGRAPSAAPSSLQIPHKLLLCNYGHAGDMLITLSFLPALKQKFPSAEIGMLCGSWNKQLVENNPLITHVHYLDHWHMDRKPGGRVKKVAAYVLRLARTVRELRSVKYDTAIDNRVWFPNAVLEIWLAGIPARVAYDFDGFSPLLTHVVRFEFDEERHERDYQAAPLACLPIDRSLLDEVPDRWLHTDGDGLQIVAQHNLEGAPPDRYVVLHPGASTDVRNWTEDGWAEIAGRAIAAGVVPVLTGLGAQQDAETARIARRVPGAVNLCSRLSWQELVAVVAGAQTVYCVETSVGHLAGALGVPCVAVYGGMQLVAQWKPAGRRVTVVTHDLPCSPCFQKAGCDQMSCLRGVTADQVWHAGT